MKTIFSITMALAFCVIANAANVDWSVEKKSFYTSDLSSNQAADYYVAVFLFENYDAVSSALSTLGTSATESLSTLSSLEVSHGVTTGRGAAEGSFTTTSASGTTFELFTVAFDAKTIGEAENYLVSSSSKSTAYVAPDNPTYTGQFKSDNYSNNWVPIPEPSVALMGLLGLGMLLKRRRA